MASTRKPAIVDQQDGEIQKGLKLHALDPRRRSVIILASLLATITLLVTATTLTLAGNATPIQIATINAAAILTALTTCYTIIRLGTRIKKLEFWIRRMGAGDLEYTVPPKGHDEITQIAYDLEVLRERSIRSQELDLVHQLSEQIKDKNEALEQILVELHNTQDQVVSRQKLAEIGELAAGIAHEVRNPLNIITNYSSTSTILMQELVETLEDTDTDQTEKAALVKEITDDLTQNMSRIEYNCDRASRITQDVTNMSRNAPSPERPIELNKMLHDYAILAYQANRAQDQSFNIKIDEDLAADVGEITCVPEELSRVFINIASNACYATHEKRRNPDTPDDYSPNMKLTTRRRGKNIIVTIRDNGTGIPDHVREKVFNPFFTTKPTNEGTGLGLSLSHEIVRHHGGNITVETEPGQYTELRIELPARAHTGQVPPDDERNQEATIDAQEAQDDQRTTELNLAEDVATWRQ